MKEKIKENVHNRGEREFVIVVVVLRVFRVWF